MGGEPLKQKEDDNERSNRLVARSAVALSLAASLTACGTASSTTTTAVSSGAATETASGNRSCFYDRKRW